MGRGPVCGMMTRRTGGPAGAAGAAETASASSMGCVDGTESDAGSGVVAAEGWAAATGVAAASSAGAGVVGLGAAAGGAAATTGRSRGGRVAAGGTADGRAMTGPTGGLLAIAGAGVGGTRLTCWRGCGTMRRGAGVVAGVGVAVVVGVAEWAAAAARGGAATGTADGGAATAAGRGGAALMAASACLRSRIALRASPGLDTFERSNLGFASTWGLAALLLRLPPLK